MCRLLGAVSRSPQPLASTLDGLLAPFTELSCEHSDGWGIAAWHEDELRIAKDVTPAHASPSFTDAVGRTTDAALLHLRKASPGLPVDRGNTHPFVRGDTAFAHNGYFTPLDAVDGLIDPDLLADAAGTTDSERYFLRVLSIMGDQEDAVDALAHAAQDIRARAEFGSLNCLLLTEMALYAYAEQDPGSEVSLRRGPQFFELSYRVTRESVTVASSGIAPAGDPAWRPLPYGQVLEIRRADLRVSVCQVRGTAATSSPLLR